MTMEAGGMSQRRESVLTPKEEMVQKIKELAESLYRVGALNQKRYEEVMKKPLTGEMKERLKLAEQRLEEVLEMHNLHETYVKACVAAVVTSGASMFWTGQFGFIAALIASLEGLRHKQYAERTEAELKRRELDVKTI